MAMLEVRDINVFFGVIQAIKNISFDVNQGEVVALIGANGAGKTTTLHTITGLLSAASGPGLWIFSKSRLMKSCCWPLWKNI